MKLKPLSEQVIVITGASSGIGRATALSAARHGARVVLVARDAAALAALEREIAGVGGEARSMGCDVADRAEVDAAAAFAIEAFGAVDTWVNNAGIALFGRLDETPEADGRRLFETNFWGTVNGSLAAVRLLRDRGGALVNVGSIAGDFGIPLQGLYCASKHAVKAFTDTLRIELESEGASISVTLIKPAAIATPILSHLVNTTGREPRLPPPHYAPGEVAHAILHAAEHPQRDIYVGGAGRLMSALATAAPHLADKVSARFGEEAQLGDVATSPDGSLGALSAGETADGESGRRSLYTRATLDRASPLAAMEAASGALFDLALSVLAPRKR